MKQTQNLKIAFVKHVSGNGPGSYKDLAVA